MNIGIDISQIVYEGTGVARFVRGLTDSIFEYDNKNHWTFFFSSLRRRLPYDFADKIKKKGYRLIKYNIPPTILSLLWNKLHLIDIENFTGKLDWLITSDWTEPPAKNIKKVTIVHDLVYLRYPQTVDKKILSTQRSRLPWVIKETKLVFSDSLATKNDLVKFLGVDADKIKIIYPGVEFKNTTSVKINKTLEKYKLNNPFILTVAKLEPRKNLKRLIAAFIQLNSKNIDLVVAGSDGWDKLNLQEAQNVRNLGFISDDELFSLYSTCLFFIFPSIWEGFGYPVIEAMSQGTAVATSNTSSLKEIAEDAALLFDPLNVGSIKNSLIKLISDKKLRLNLAQKGKERSKQFTWKNYYENMINAIENYQF